ncbi:MAG: SufD family Fe-S cluster assembly protein [Vampirovibrionales bacterium]|nr:SufD family Fe-S cluster assembly protein [Vampirovibrionales bacterium]
MSAQAFEGLEPTALTWLLRPSDALSEETSTEKGCTGEIVEPAWLTERRQQAQARFSEVGAPSRRDDAWKYVDLRTLQQTSFTPARALSVENEARAFDQLTSAGHLLPEAAPLRLAFVNGAFCPRLSSSQADIDEAAPGLVLTTLQAFLRAPEQWPDAINKDLPQSFLAGVSQEDDAFALLNAIHSRDAALVILPEGVTLARPLQLLFSQSGSAEHPQLSAQRAFVSMGARSQATILVQTVGEDATPYWANTGLDCLCAEESRLNLVIAQVDGENGAGFLATRARLDQKAHLSLTCATFGGHIARHALTVRLTGENAHLALHGLNTLRGQTQSHQRAVVIHETPNASSAQTFKGILDEQSRADFDGIIVVSRDAVGTDATQLNKNLLLSEEAVAYARPQLRIDADDVKCAHGATVGQLEPDELFYLTSRGLPSAVAQCLLTFGFAEDIAQSVADPAIRQYLERLILRNLDHQNSPLSCFTECEICPASQSAHGC